MLNSLTSNSLISRVKIEIRKYVEVFQTWRVQQGLSAKILLSFATFLAGLVGLIGVGWLVLTTSKSTVTASSSSDLASSQSGTSRPERSTPPLPASTPKQIVIDVAGAVTSPGIYTLDEGSRVYQAIEAAGGLSRDADPSHVVTSLNQAAVLKDGQKIVIASETDQIQFEDSVPSSSQPVLVSVNNATQKQLEDLPVIGTKTAAKIIELRPFQSLDEFQQKIGLTEKEFSTLTPHIQL